MTGILRVWRADTIPTGLGHIALAKWQISTTGSEAVKASRSPIQDAMAWVNHVGQEVPEILPTPR